MKAALSLAVLLSATAAFARPRPVQTTWTHDQIVDKTSAGLRLLQLGPDQSPVWFSEEGKLELMRAEVRFVDVTETYEDKLAIKAAVAEAKLASPQRVSFPSPSHQTAVKALLPNLSISRMNSTLTQLTALNNRYYRSSTGAQASTLILNTVNSIISGRSDISAALYAHSWTQSSIIAKVAGATNNTAPMVILGAHMDSINLSSPTSGRAPGADDDGTGTVNSIEILRVLVEAGWKPATPVEFHWYSGEEGGLLGSDAIATAYKKAGKQVKAMMELDMSGYFAPGSKEVIAIEADYIDSGLNTFTKSLVTSYSAITYAMDTPCGYACSDHASWYDQGYPTTMLYEAVTGDDNQRIHSSSDTITVSGFSWSHSLEFAKVALGFVYELSA
ncbi:aminopeptidase [Exidia glandulosa HHB12029]|uniref:Peptide hydrolase n=1 Tax=Exidia glandulosa HHB12029 TaxID=1314781 RepID=A0A165DNU4_EXIGL|nr:aminopeptidase [Exidia glandulosa HHB12029]